MSTIVGNLSVKKLYKEIANSQGTQIIAIEENTSIQAGDKLIVRLIIQSNRDFDYVALKDQRAAGLEPIQALSGYQWKNNLGYYLSVKDASMNFYFYQIPKGTYVLEYPLRVTHSGNFTNGITSIQCLYAPEFSSHSGGNRLIVK